MGVKNGKICTHENGNALQNNQKNFNLTASDKE
jgi:hypothetical protein